MERELKIALAGNPNCGKTTLFNALTGSNQFVGNWPGVTVEKKEGKLKGHKNVIVMDLPGIYSLSPYTLEEVVARNYLIGERPDAILNIIDGTNLERNLYLTTQLVELGIPVVIAVNMMDVVKKNGDKIDIKELSRELGCEVYEISALKGTGIMDAANAAVAACTSTKTVPQHTFAGPVEHALAHIEEAVVHNMPEEQQRWYAVKVFERDDKVLAQLNIPKALETYPVGGFVLTGSNIQDKDQLDKLMERLKKTSSVTPLFALQEEGGMGATIAGKEAFGLAKTETPAALGSTGDGAKVKDAAATIGKALADLGFQMNLAPTCDVGSALSFSESPEQAAMCTSAAVEGFHEGGVACVLKHYPGQGGTNASEGASLTETWETMRTTSLYPFQAGMAAGADAIMVSHVTTPNASSDGLPASLSQEMVTSKLRGELRFSRLIMTAPLSDPAIAQHYDSGDAALRAFQAGADILLQPEDLEAAYTAVLSAVKDGAISQQRLDESVLRVLQLKERYGLI